MTLDAKTLPQLPIFVYGTLLPGQPNAHLWQDAIVDAKTAYFRDGCLYSLGAYPMLIEQEGCVTQGQVMTLATDAYAATLARLDLLEGCDPEDEAASTYRRVRRDVLAVGKTVSAWVYVGRPEIVDGLPRIEDGDWLAHTAARGASLKRWWSTVESVRGRHRQ